MRVPRTTKPIASVAIVALAIAAALGGCGGNDGGAPGTDPGEPTSSTNGDPIQWDSVPWQSGLTAPAGRYNAEAPIPPQCYTKTEGRFNPCYTCHQTYDDRARPNYMDDGQLQGDYNFSDVGVTNHWENLFVDRSAAVAAIPDEAILAYIGQDNYGPFVERLSADPSWSGPVPAIESLADGAEAFDAQGFARGGSHWVAFNYKPLPSTFWPTNGNTDDVMVRLPARFREARACSSEGYSREVYLANLSILEMAMKELDRISVPPLDETRLCADLNGDGAIQGEITEIAPRPDNYVGRADVVPVATMLYPEGTEFLHTVRYVGVGADGAIGPSRRMKEVRYMKKLVFNEKSLIRSIYGNEKQEKLEGALPTFSDHGDRGLVNDFGWQVLGFIEDADGELRQQTREEQTFCMGCHSAIGGTLDQTFAFPRKVTGARGWGYIDYRALEDAPSYGSDEAEILEYLRRVGGGNEFRENDEMQSRWFDDNGDVREDAVRRASVYELITPSPERALRMNKAYRLIVKNQTFIFGRDATVEPARNVYRGVDPDAAPPLEAEHRVGGYDIRLRWND